MGKLQHFRKIDKFAFPLLQFTLINRSQKELYRLSHGAEGLQHEKARAACTRLAQPLPTRRWWNPKYKQYAPI